MALFKKIILNKKAVYALLVALVLPLGSYFFMKYYSDAHIKVPPHYIADSVVTKMVNGKEISETFWHKMPDYSFTNQLGNEVSWKDMEGKVVVVNFFFTHCPTICPSLTMNMRRLQESIKNSMKVGDKEPNFLQFISFSIDPERDSVEALKKWADRFQVNPSNWWLLTGDKKKIYDMSLEHMKIGIQDGENVDSNFIHTDRFVLIDKERNIRGYYHGLDTVSLAKLSEDIIFLSLEKDKNSKSIFEGKLEMIAIVFIFSFLALMTFLYFIKKKNQ